MIKPKILVSSCLGFEASRFDGSKLDNAFVRRMRENETFEFNIVCPEVGIGLGIPRDPLRLVMKNGDIRLIQPSTNRDLTELMEEYTNKITENLVVDGFILKADSPSVGTNNVKVYPSEEAFSGRRGGAGLFTSLIMKKFPNYPIESDRRLRNVHIQHVFLKKVYTIARFHSQVSLDSYESLKKFHSKNCFLLKSHHVEKYSMLENITDTKKKYGKGVLEEYFNCMLEILRFGSNRDGMITVFDEIFSRMSKNLPEIQVKFYKEKILLFQKNLIQESAITTLLENLAIGLGDEFLIDQTMFNPYPLEAIKYEDPYEKRFLANSYDLD